MALAKYVEIKESESCLRTLMRKSIPMISCRLNMLLQIKKSDVSLSARKLSKILGVDAKSVWTWRREYLEGGIEALMHHDRKGSASRIFGEAERDYLRGMLENPQNGIQGYAELRRMMNEHFGKDFDYVTLSEYCKRHFGTKIKVARKSHIKKDEKAVADFKKNFTQNLNAVVEEVKNDYSGITVWFEDESRFGLMTCNGKSLTVKGVKPVCPFQQKFESAWLYGAFSPTKQEHFMLEFSVCDSVCFQLFLDAFAAEHPDEMSVIVLDNGAFHKAKHLAVPPNVRLIFLPPYSPELNPAEKMWAKFKRAFTNKLFKTMDEMKDFISKLVNTLEKEEVATVCNCNYI